MLVAVIGGKLQGIEATYLAHKAGWEVMLVDTNQAVPASGLCNFFVPMDSSDDGWLDSILKDTDLIIPATENREILKILSKRCRNTDIPFAFDVDAYEISSSKLESDRLFASIGIPAPVPWPKCGFPVIAKPSSGSGSQWIQVFHNQRQLEKRFSNPLLPNDWVLQEYLEGPSYSLEVIGYPGHYSALQVTDLEMDADYDCKRVLAPTQLQPREVSQLKKISMKIAEAIRLHGLMDVEVILHKGQCKVLEIDARLPSQTPTAIYWSTGCNILQLLSRCFLNKEDRNNEMAKGIKMVNLPKQGVIYEHIKVSSNSLQVCGEHIMSHTGPLFLETDFFGADEAITNYTHGRLPWMATLIVMGSDRKEAWEKRNRIIDNILSYFKLDTYIDPVPFKGVVGS